MRTEVNSHSLESLNTLANAMPAILVDNLSKRYGAHWALKDVSFSIDQGEVVGFLGPNGAGKSTTMKILTGFITPSGGRAEINGIDVLTRPNEAQKELGYLPENAPIYPDMTVHGYLKFVAKVRGLGRNERVKAIDKACQQCDITDRLKQPIGQLSKGFRQRVGLAQALLSESKILILDEPTTGLDPNQIVEIRNLIREIGKTRTILLSTHILSEVQATCNRAIIINNGVLAADGPVEDLIVHAQGGTNLAVELANGAVSMRSSQIKEKLEKIDGVKHVNLLATASKTHCFNVLTTRDIAREYSI